MRRLSCCLPRPGSWEKRGGCDQDAKSTASWQIADFSVEHHSTTRITHTHHPTPAAVGAWLLGCGMPCPRPPLTNDSSGPADASRRDGAWTWHPKRHGGSVPPGRRRPARPGADVISHVPRQFEVGLAAAVCRLSRAGSGLGIFRRRLQSFCRNESSSN